MATHAVSSNLRNGEIDALRHIAKVLYTGTGKELWLFLEAPTSEDWEENLNNIVHIHIFFHHVFLMVLDGVIWQNVMWLAVWSEGLSVCILTKGVLETVWLIKETKILLFTDNPYDWRIPTKFKINNVISNYSLGSPLFLDFRSCAMTSSIRLWSRNFPCVIKKIFPFNILYCNSNNMAGCLLMISCHVCSTCFCPVLPLRDTMALRV